MGSDMVLSEKKIMWICPSSADSEKLFSLPIFVILKKRDRLRNKSKRLQMLVVGNKDCRIFG
jgi:hypothetical protein